MARLGPLAWPAAIAVSGGADSIALMHLLADWARTRALPPPAVLSVDHRLQNGSAAVAKIAVEAAAARGLCAHILIWRGAKPDGDIEAAAREARYRLMGRWCKTHKIAALYVAHTLEDQAETFLLRLARGSGLDGLAGMQACAPFPLPGFPGLAILRPLLQTPREELRAFLSRRQIAWHEDAMNSDPRFARVQLRQAWPGLRAAGLTPERIAAAAAHLARARMALEAATEAFLAHQIVRMRDGVLVDAGALAALPREIGLRVLAALLMGIGGGTYRPRFERLERLYDSIAAGQIGGGRTLGGCRVALAPKRQQHFGAQTLQILRETVRRTVPPAKGEIGAKRASRLARNLHGADVET